MRKLFSKLNLFIFAICCSVFMSADLVNSGAAPTGYTGAEGSTCIDCHAGNSLNAPGGSVTIEGLPSTYTPGSSYDFSVKINHATADRKRWGFSVKAVTNIDPTVVGTFSETNPNARISDGEIGHQSAPTTSQSISYTFDKLRWTAPSNPNTAQSNITFYVVGNAANGRGDGGDYIYTDVKNMTLAPLPTSVSNLLVESDQWKVINAGKNLNIQMNLKKSIKMQVSLFSAGGQKIMDKPTQTYPSGINTIQLEGINLKSGTYIVVLQNEKGKASRKIIL